MGDDENGRECSIGSWESLLFETDDTLVLPPFADQDFHPNICKDHTCVHRLEVDEKYDD